MKNVYVKKNVPHRRGGESEVVVMSICACVGKASGDRRKTMKKGLCRCVCKGWINKSVYINKM